MKKPSYMAWFWTELGFDKLRVNSIEVQLLAGKGGMPRKWLHAAVHGGYLKADTSRQPWTVSRAEALRFENEVIVPLVAEFKAKDGE